MPDVDDPNGVARDSAVQGELDRRGVLARLLGAVGGLLGISLLGGCPGGSTYGKSFTASAPQGQAPPESSKIEWDTVGLPDGIAAEFKVNGKPAYLLKTPVQGENKYIALLRRCPHSGCTVNYSYVTHQIECPCHGSQFDTQGNVLKGPAKRSLTRLNVREEAGKVIVEAPGSYLGHGGVWNQYIGQ